MTYLTFNKQRYQLSKNETVLDCLQRNGVDYPSSCKSGVCQSCLTKTSNIDSVNPAWQKGLKPALAADGYFLACQAKPENDFNCSYPTSADISSSAKIFSIEKKNHNVVSLKLNTNDYDLWTPGKYLNLVNSHGVIRSYSIANLPGQDNFIELHIKIFPHGEMSTWLEKQAKIGDELEIRGPIGSCFYANPNNQAFPIILIGTGTGLAPLIGILKDAIAKNHTGSIELIHGGVSHDDLYLDNELRNLQDSLASFTYKPSVLQGNQAPSLEELLAASVQEHQNANVYVCGPEEITNKLKMKAFLAGISSSSIYSDAFLISKNN